MYRIVQVQSDGSVEPVELIDHPITWFGRGKWCFQPIITNLIDANKIVEKLNKRISREGTIMEGLYLTEKSPEYRVQSVTITTP